MTTMNTMKKAYVAPQVVQYGSVIALTGACDGPCIDGIPGGQDEL